MDVQITRTGGLFLYDAYRDGYDTTLIKNITGTPSISSNKLLVNNCDVATFAAAVNSQVEMLLNFPVAPTAGQSKVFGLKQPNGGNRGAIVFDITDTALTAKVYKADGSATLFSQAITWSSVWTTTDTRFRIMFTERNVSFYIEDSRVAVFESTALARLPLPIRITNGNADNLLVATLALY